MSERAKVMTALAQLEPHSPAWARMIRRYIIGLERELGINPEFNAQLRKRAGKPVNALTSLTQADRKMK